MDNKRISIEDDVPRHRKKSKKKGQPRADHKHEYKTVLLHSYFDSPFGRERFEDKRPVEVCAICGRVGHTVFNRYEYVKIPNTRRSYDQAIRDEESLEKWYVDDYFDKFAKRMEI